jgi:hypothetical protein
VLTAYQNATSALLQNPPATTPLYSTANLTTYINTARGQLAGEAQCIRAIGTLPLTGGSGIYEYAMSAITLPSSVGLKGVINVRSVWLTSGTGQTWMYPRSFEWFSLFNLNNSAPVAGTPADWAQYGQGASMQGSPLPTGGGTVYISPTPSANGTLNLDCVCFPIPLASDSDPEAIPYLWTDAVPYFAAYLALLSAQSTARDADAQRMFALYELFVQRASKAATSQVLPWLSPQQMIGSPPTAPGK